MVLTRYQAALAHFLAQENNSNSEDEEIVLGLGDQGVAGGDEGESDIIADTLSVHSTDMAGQSERLEAVEAAVHNINSKFDSLLAAVAGG